jgi:phenylacetate-CoA ligase
VAALMEEMKEKPVSLEEVSCFGEPLAPDLIARLRDVWNVRVSENYSTNETGYIAIRCPDSDDLHIQSEGAFVEILGESGAPCEVGQSGRVVVTPLHNLAMPLIRYDIGDYATVGAPCRCGRGLPVIRQVLGRERNFAHTPEGTRYWPVDLGKLREIRAVRQFQFVQTAQDTIQLRLVLNQPLTTDEQQRAMDLTRIALGYPFNVEIIPVPRIERGPGGKFEDFLSLLPKT